MFAFNDDHLSGQTGFSLEGRASSVGGTLRPLSCPPFGSPSGRKPHTSHQFKRSWPAGPASLLLASLSAACCLPVRGGVGNSSSPPCECKNLSLNASYLSWLSISNMSMDIHAFAERLDNTVNCSIDVRKASTLI